MSGRNLLIFLVAFLFMLAGGVGGAAAQERQEVHDVGTAAIRGRILGANNEGPLARAEVYLHGRGTRVVLTDDEGRYAFTNLPAGRYTLTTGRAGYVSIGAKESIELADGQSRRQADIALSHGGAIEATVVNESGEPMPRITVFALRRLPKAGMPLERVFPEQRPDPSQSLAQTDDRGQVRLYDLPPGRYYLMASPFTYEIALDAKVTRSEWQSADYGIAIAPEATTVVAGADVSAQISLTTKVPRQEALWLEPSRPAMDPRARGRISGRVLAADGSGPLRAARVILEPAPSDAGREREAITDGEGRFEFVHVSDGGYTLTAAARGYLTRAYGQRARVSPMHAVQVAHGAAVAHVDLTLIAAGSITVRITDDRGLPHAGVQVALLDRWPETDGYRLTRVKLSTDWQPIPNALLTDDRGEVRLRELPAGDYWLSASFHEHETMLMEPPDAASDQPLTCATTYFPGVIATGLAQPIALDTGEHRTVGFSLMPARTARLGGRVISSEGEAARGSLIALRVKKDGNYEDWDRTELADGRFTFSQVPPGEYQLEYPDARYREDSDQFAALPLVVDGADQTGLIVTTAPPGTLRGRITFDTGSIPDGLTPEDIAGAAGSPKIWTISTLEIAPDWTFIAKGIRGPALFYVDASGKPWHLRSVLLDGVDVTHTPVREADNLEIVMTRGSNVGGTVVDGHNTPLFNCLVLIFAAAGADPTEHRRNEYVNTADRGRFDIESLAPGRYFALPLPTGMQEDPMTSDAFARLESQATAFTVPDAEPRTVWLPLTININDQP